ncbi:MAG: carbohydrate porin [Reyranellaceae bacterium]
MCAGLVLGALAGRARAQGAPDPVDEEPARVVSAVSGNPAATTFSTGTGWLGRTLGLKPEWGLTLGGLWLADTNLVVAGGVQPGGWTNNSALFLGLGIDAEKLVGWRGAAFGFQMLQLNGGNTNGEAGVVTGYNGIVGSPPWQRTELYEAWYEQTFIKDVLKTRIGRSSPNIDFNNVLRPVMLTDSKENIPAVSGVLMTSIFVNTSMLGVLPGYYNTGTGVTVNFTPSRSFYVNLGVYDGNMARGQQTGLVPVQFNGYTFNIAEIGTNWVLGEGNHPGQFAIGLWRQTGQLSAAGITEDGTGGFYLFGSQRLAFGVNPQTTSSSVSMFYQFGANASQTLPVNHFYGAGLTGYGLVGERERDSMGIGFGLSRMNQNIFARPTELLLQAYYQFHLVSAIFLQPTVTFIPQPAASASVPSTLTTTLRLTVLF